MLRPEEATVYIVGCAGTLGLDIARGFVQEGTQRIGLVCADTESGERAAEQVRSMAPGLWSLSSAADPADLPAVLRATAELGAALGPANIVVQLLGGSGRSRDEALPVPRQLDEMINISRAALPHMRADAGGAIVAVTAGDSDGDVPGRAGAAADVTAAAIAFTRTLDMAVEPDGVRVNLVIPESRGRQSGVEVAELVRSCCRADTAGRGPDGQAEQAGRSRNR